MEWLTQNWIWLLLAAVVGVMLFRHGGHRRHGGNGACCGHGYKRGADKSAPEGHQH